MMMHEVEIKKMLKNVKKNDVKALIKINQNIHFEMTIKKIKQFIKNNTQKNSSR